MTGPGELANFFSGFGLSFFFKRLRLLIFFLKLLLLQGAKNMRLKLLTIC